MRKTILPLVFCSLLISCALSEAAMREARSKMVTALPIPTSTQVPITFTPTIFPLPTYTLAPTPDLRIITDDPRSFLLKAEDLPLDAHYYLPDSSWTEHISNQRILQGWTVERGKDYIAKTGRIDGWFIHFKRGTEALAIPAEMWNEVIMFKNADFAKNVLMNFNASIAFPEEKWKIIDKELNLGDQCLVLKSGVNNGSQIIISYEIDCIYRNYDARVVGIGVEKDVTHDFVEAAARKVLERLKQADLTLPETTTPTP